MDPSSDVSSQDLKSSEVKTSPKDVFLHLLMVVTLLMSVVSFITLVFQYINILMPDPLDYGNPYDGIRWATAVLIVSFPVFIWLSYLIEKELKINPAKREIGIRKWLIYLTLFVAALVIIIDLITLIYNFYGGDLTGPFFLKVLVVLVTAAIVFWYYRFELKREDTDNTIPKNFAWITSAIVLGSIIAGFFVAGSPAQQRDVRFDMQRVEDLQGIQFDISQFWQNTERLPEDLDELEDELIGIRAPKDPVTDEAYEYNVIDEFTFELCAEFQTESSKSRYRSTYPVGPFDRDAETWNHGMGRHCFERTINPERLKPEAVR